jgi:Replication initiator protein A
MAPTRPQPQEELQPAAPRIGRDEMNLAEFPIALLADRAPKGQKTLYFEDQHGRLTVTGSDAYGLPTATDTDVIVALIYLTKLQNDFRDVKVNFSRYGLIKLLNWPFEGGSYKRLDLSFNRWHGVSLVYDKCWWNNKTKRYVSAKMHIIDSVIFAEPGGHSRDGQAHLPLSMFTWNKTFIESCQADNLRQLDLDEYFSLKSAVAKRLYRFLGKRFYRQDDWTFDLHEIAFERVGLSRSYADAYKIKEKLHPAIEELEAIGFLRPLKRDDRYGRIDRGQWTIRLVRQSPTHATSAGQTLIAPQHPTLPLAEPEPSPLVAALVARGMTRATVEELAREYPERIERQLEHFDWRMEKKPGKIAEPGAYLADAIKKDYAAPKGFVSRAERERQAEAARQRQEAEAEASRRQRQEEARERAERQAVNAYRESRTPEQLRQLEADALEQADAQWRATYDEAFPEMKKMVLSGIVTQHIKRILESQQAEA